MWRTAETQRKLREAVEPALMVTPEELQGTSSIARTASSASQVRSHRPHPSEATPSGECGNESR